MGRITRPILASAVFGASAGVRAGLVLYMTGRYLLDAESWREPGLCGDA